MKPTVKLRKEIEKKEEHYFTYASLTYGPDFLELDSISCGLEKSSRDRLSFLITKTCPCNINRFLKL